MYYRNLIKVLNLFKAIYFDADIKFSPQRTKVSNKILLGFMLPLMFYFVLITTDILIL